MKTYMRAMTALLVMLLAACADRAATPAADAARQQPPSAQDFAGAHARWVSERDADLRRPDGWTSLTGLHWIADGTQRVGSADGSEIRLAIAPAALGRVELHDGSVRFTPAEGVAISVDDQPLRGPTLLQPSGAEPGTVLHYDGGKGRIALIQRGDRVALRVHHADATTRTGFKGVAFWPADSAWRVQARFVAHPSGRTLPIVNVLGDVSDVPNPGYVEFQRDGATWRLEALGDPAKSLNLMFKDATSGRESYGVGRYLRTGAVAAGGHVELDFNRATNPPCAYTDYATCPLPPLENGLVRDDNGRKRRLSVTAGEKRYVASAH